MPAKSGVRETLRGLCWYSRKDVPESFGMTEPRGALPVILLVEDDPAHSEAMARALSAHGQYRLQFASTLAAAQHAIVLERPALVLADLNLGDGKALDLLSGPGVEPPLPVLVLTSHGDEQTAVRAMRYGGLLVPVARQHEHGQWGLHTGT